MAFKLYTLSIISFFFCILMNVVGIYIAPVILKDLDIATFFLWLMIVSTFSIWLLPILIAWRRKEIRDRKFIMCLSFFLPLVGGFFSYFLIRKRLGSLGE